MNTESAPTVASPISEQDIEEFVKILHSQHDNLVCNSRQEHDCTTHAVAKATGCDNITRFWCQQRYNDYLDKWDEVICADCKRNSEDCWKVVLI